MPRNYTLTSQERDDRKNRIAQVSAQLSPEQRRERSQKAANTREARRKQERKRLQELEKFLADMRTIQTP